MPVNTQLIRDGEPVSLTWNFPMTQGLWWATVRCTIAAGVPFEQAEKNDFYPQSFVYTEDFTIVVYEPVSGGEDGEGFYAKTVVLDHVKGIEKFTNTIKGEIELNHEFKEKGLTYKITDIFEIKKGDTYRCWRGM